MMSSEVYFEGKVVRIREQEDQKEGWVEFQGVRIRVDLSLLPQVQIGDRVLVHGRMALSLVQNQ